MKKIGIDDFKKAVEKRNSTLLRMHLKHKAPYKVNYGGYPLTIFPGVFCPTYGEGSILMLNCKSHLAGKSVLDVGTGSGALAILAAEKSKHIVATDISPKALQCAKANVEKLGLAKKVELRQGDLFDALRSIEKFDVIVFNAPFLKGRPASIFQKSIYDENYKTLEMFFEGVSGHLSEKGRILLCFGNVGDLSYLHWLIATMGFSYRIVAESVVSKLEFMVYELKRGI